MYSSILGAEDTLSELAVPIGVFIEVDEDFAGSRVKMFDTVNR